jgi:hypothetical protein
MPTLLPSAIVSQSGLYGSLAALADDPADPDELWMTVTDPDPGTGWRADSSTITADSGTYTADAG